jgi:hypothetical protein
MKERIYRKTNEKEYLSNKNYMKIIYIAREVWLDSEK